VPHSASFTRRRRKLHFNRSGVSRTTATATSQRHRYCSHASGATDVWVASVDVSPAFTELIWLTCTGSGARCGAGACLAKGRYALQRAIHAPEHAAAAVAVSAAIVGTACSSTVAVTATHAAATVDTACASAVAVRATYAAATIGTACVSAVAVTARAAKGYGALCCY
jgi:hypothetical protein